MVVSGAENVEEDFRSVFFNVPEVAQNAKFCNNKIRTALYCADPLLIRTPPYFLIKGVVIEEFSKLANFYFLVIIALQSWSETTNTNGFPTTSPALTLVVVFASVIKFRQDIERFRADKALNEAACQRLVGGRFVASKWTQVKVGDFIKVDNREMLPADIVLVSAFEPDPAIPVGACYVETKSLDQPSRPQSDTAIRHGLLTRWPLELNRARARAQGETNLKGRSVPKIFLNMCGGSLDSQTRGLSSADFKGKLLIERPNPQTNKFTGKVMLQNQPEVVLSINNVLLRGSSVRNTEYVIGLVVNTGRDSKVMQGMRAPPLKHSSVDHWVNYMMIGVMLTQLSLCIISAFIHDGWNASLDVHWYMHEDLNEETPLPGIIFTMLSYYVVLSMFVSVSLYVSIDFNRTLYKTIMEKDPLMWHEESGTRLKVRTMSLIDECGCVSHIFSDKTGTLTQNVMQFRKCSINGVSYGHGNTEIGRARLRRLELFRALEGGAGIEQRDRCRDFMLALALCHTVVVEMHGNEKRLSASSPDEAALVAAANFFGIEFINKQHSTVTLKDSFTGQSPTFEVLDVLEFTSARKRMSVVVREPKSGRIRMIIKGADSAIFPLLATGQDDILRATERHLEDHANDGLRTLLLAQKSLDEATYTDWARRYRAALTDLAELEKKEKELPNLIEKTMGELEHGLLLVGSTAIEDKLQDGVPHAIADLGRAGIAVWVLTGDKEETAINIAFACELFDTRTTVLVLNLKSHPTAKEVLAELTKSGKAAAGSASSGGKHALVIDGEVISLVMADKKLQLAMLELTQNCQSVVACRCAPSQKAQLVSLVKVNVKGAITLAIGDGANDVAMIQAAHIGVGISGQEGMQAANSADFSFAQFRFLLPLLLQHGRNHYRRMSTLTIYIFYKNIAMCLAMYWYIFSTAGTPQRVYLEGGIQFYNVLYTLVPIVIYSLYDKDVSDELSIKLPQLYHLGVRKVYMNLSVVLRWLFEALAESLIVFYLIVPSIMLPAGTTEITIFDKKGTTGETGSLMYLGDVLFASVLITITSKLCMRSFSQSRALYGFIALCLALYWGSYFFASTIKATDSLYTWGAQMYTGLWLKFVLNPQYWLFIFMTAVSCLGWQFFLSLWQRTFYPEFRDLAREAEYLGMSTDHLRRWSIPLTMRRLPLRPDAPRSVEPPPSLFARLVACCSCA